jgi:hypothetical protein
MDTGNQLKKILSTTDIDKQSERRSNLTKQERCAQKSAKAKQSMKKQSIVKNLKWFEKVLSMGNARERKDVLQMWDTRFSGWIPGFKLLVSCWILLKNTNLKGSLCSKQNQSHAGSEGINCYCPANPHIQLAGEYNKVAEFNIILKPWSDNMCIYWCCKNKVDIFQNVAK